MRERYDLVVADLRNIYLEDSFVLDIREAEDSLTFGMEFVLTPEHTLYRPPAPNEQHCYRRGILSFRGVTELSWKKRAGIPSRDETGEEDWGAIDVFTLDRKRCRLEGDWGEVELLADTVSITLLD